MDPALKRYLAALSGISEAYREWDKFDHKSAYRNLQKSVNELTVYAECSGDISAVELTNAVACNLDFLDSFKQASLEYKETCSYHVLDLLSNSLRRAKENKYDDAIARLYRTLEMIAQERLWTGYKLNASNIPLENKIVIKALLSMNPWFKEKHIRGDSASLELSLYSDYEFLKALGDELGVQYFIREKEIRQVLDARNHSILAHGSRILDKNDFDRMWKLVMDFSGLVEKALPVFPQLPVPCA